MTVYALRYKPSGRWVRARCIFPGQTEGLTLDCLFERGPDASFARVAMADPEHYDCSPSDFEVYEIDLEVGESRLRTGPGY